MPVIPISDRVRLITGRDGSRFPDANAFLVEDRVRTLIDTGCDESVLRGIGRVDRIICTHYHLDHIRKNWLFPDAEVWVPAPDAGVFRGGLPALARMVGLEGDAAERWARELPTEPPPVRHSMRDPHEWRTTARPPA